MTEFRNDSNLIFDDISSEQFREYQYTNGDVLRIDSPLQLNVSPNGHRVYSAHGVCYYIPKGWRNIAWRVKEGAPHFVK